MREHPLDAYDDLTGEDYAAALAEFEADKAAYCRAVDNEGCSCAPHPRFDIFAQLNRWCREHGILKTVPAELTQSVSGIRGGEPCMLGTRVPVEQVSTLLEDGATWEQVQETYPSIPTPAAGMPHTPAPDAREYMVIVPSLCGSPVDYQTAYRTDGVRKPTREAAIAHGLAAEGHDDWLIAIVSGDTLLGLAWQHEDRDDAEEVEEAARALGLTAAPEMPRPAPEAAAPGLAAEKRPEGRTGVSETLSEAHAIEEGIAREWIAIPADDATEEWGVRRRDGRVQRFEDRADAEEFAEAWRDLDRTVVHRYVGPWESAARDEEEGR